MPHLTISATAMGFRVGVNKRGDIKGTHLSIIPFSSKFQQKSYDRLEGKWTVVNEFFYYDDKNEIVYFPKYALEEFRTFLNSNGITITVEEISSVEGKDIKFLMLPFVEYKNDKQKNAVEFITSESTGPVRGLALQTGVGKLQPLDSLVRIPGGWRMMGNISLGDDIVTPDGGTAKVTGIYPQGTVPIYRVYFEDGRWTECGLDHLWRVFFIQWPERWRVMTLREIIKYQNDGHAKNRLFIQLPEPEQCEDVDLPIDPYVLGVILGDGTITKSGVIITKPDQFIKDEVSRLLPSYSIVSDWYSDNKSYSIKPNRDHSENNSSLNGAHRSKFFSDLLKLGLGGSIHDTKFIPNIYMNASPNQKLSLLQGLMDTDGYASRPMFNRNGTPNEKGTGSAEFCTTSKEMALQFQMLVRSLGGLCKIKEKVPFYTYLGERKQGKLAYILKPRMKDPSVLFRLPRKKNNLIGEYQYSDSLRLKLKGIEYVGKKPAQCIMVDHPDHLYITDDYIVTHNTVAAIWGLQKLHKRCMITMTSRLEQWVKEFTKYTNLEEDEIYVIQGLGSLTKLFNKIDNGITPKIILASTATMRLYIEYRPSYQHLPHPSKMCEELGIGIIATDEYHEHYHTNFMIGIVTNPRVMIPITATFSASDPFVKNILDQFIPKDLQFVGGEYDKYVNVTSYTYRGAGHLIRPYQYTSRQGYSQQMFEKFLMSKKGKFVLDPLVQDAIIPIVRDHYINICEDGEKFLFLCSSTKLCDHLEGVFKRAFNSKTVSVFYSGMPTTILEKFDIIISTPGSAGTGRDIKNLRTCFAFENTNSEIRNLQFIGRLRPFPAVKNTPEFTYISFSCIPQHQKYSNARAVLYGPRSLSFKHRSIS